MAEPITTAGRQPEAPRDPRKEAILVAGRTIRDPKSSEDEVDAAIELLLDLTKE